jgi:choline dehydrogenase
MHVVDYVVIGGGSAGCVIAGRLSEDPGWSVLLLEEGPRDLSPYIHLPVTYYKTAQGNLLARYLWETGPDHAGVAQPNFAQARVLGGGSSVNAMVYIRGVPSDYDSWEAAGATGWSFEDVLPYFKRSEHNERFCNENHGIDGPVGVSDPGHVHRLTKVWLQACQQAGLPYNPDFNSGVQYGCGLYQITTRDGRRSSTSVAYLKPARKRKNLSVKTGMRVLRILLDKGRAVGVEYAHKGQVGRVFAEAEVIVSAGAINSPKILMLSGIGPADHLKSHGIPVVSDLRGVGQNLQDHVEVSLISELTGPHSYDKYKKLHWQAVAGLRYLLFRDGPVSSNVVEGGAFWRSAHATEAGADSQYCFFPCAGIEEGVAAVPSGNGCTLNVCQTRPKSVGSVGLRSSDPSAMPLIRPNYLQEKQDVDCMADAVAYGREIMSQPALKKFIRNEYIPAEPLRTRADYIAFVRKEAHAALHPVGTCRMGDAAAVLDPQLRVRGIDRLRVADASVMPNLCSGNTNAASIMIGEKAADLIRRAG